MRWTKEGLEIDLIELTIKIRNWANERDLHRANPDKQILKLGEEFGELCQVNADWDKFRRLRFDSIQRNQG